MHARINERAAIRLRIAACIDDKGRVGIHTWSRDCDGSMMVREEVIDAPTVSEHIHDLDVREQYAEGPWGVSFHRPDAITPRFEQRLGGLL
jgi:hypothetical protein